MFEKTGEKYAASCDIVQRRKLRVKQLAPTTSWLPLPNPA
jgi:hypothetical protein